MGRIQGLEKRGWVLKFVFCANDPASSPPWISPGRPEAVTVAAACRDTTGLGWESAIRTLGPHCSQPRNSCCIKAQYFTAVVRQIMSHVFPISNRLFKGSFSHVSPWMLEIMSVFPLACILVVKKSKHKH